MTEIAFSKIVCEFLKGLSQKLSRNINEEPSHKHYIFGADSMVEDIYNGNTSFFSWEDRKVHLVRNSVYHLGKRFFRPADIRENHISWKKSPYKGMVPDSFKGGLTLKDYEAAIKKDPKGVTQRIVEELVENGMKVQLKKFVKHTAKMDECGDPPSINDFYTFRQMMLVVLAVENTTHRPIRFHSVKGVTHDPGDSIGYRDFDDKDGTPTVYHHQMKRLEPGEVLLIPECFILAPLGWDPNEQKEYDPTSAWGNGEIMYAEGIIDLTLLPDFKIIGPSFTPQHLRLRASELPKDSFAARKLDLTKLHAIGKHIFCGSCPYVFGVNEQGVTYLGDILTFGYNEIDISEYDAIEIHELEEETAYIETLHLDDDLKSSEVIMNRGDHLRIENPARAYRLLRIKGHYEAAFDGYSDEIIAHKHRLIQGQMERMREDLCFYQNRL
jgi:hypothetical protein